MSEEMNNSLVCEAVVNDNIFGGVGCETYTDRGIVGESAYEQAVSGGYTGTKQEFEQLLSYDLTTIADGIDDVVENLPAIQSASENADKAQKWAEGTDAQVTPLGGEHSAKGWANVAKGYADSIDLTNYRTAAAQDTIDATKQPKTLSAAITVNGQSQTTVEGALNAINENSSIANTSLSNLNSTGESHFDSTYVKLKSGVTQANTNFVVETYVNGTSWYRVWSDGWCEQGGQTDSVGYDTSTTINLLKKMKNTNYLTLLNYFNSDNTDTMSLHTTSKTVDDFKVYISRIENRNTGTRYVVWSVFGYISEEE